MKVRRFFLPIAIVFAGVVWLSATHRTVQSKEVSPFGKYTAICSYKTYLSLIPMAPGSSSDKPCFVKIIDNKGKSYGEIPVPMLQLADVEWTDHGAKVQLVGEWNFDETSCYYWSKDQSTQIYVKR